MSAHPVIVVGGGINGLSAAAYLARAGVRVIVLEGRPILGGLYATEEFHPGFRASRGHDVGLQFEAVRAELELDLRHGLRNIALSVHATAIQESSPPLTIFPNALRDGPLPQAGGEGDALEAFESDLAPAVDLIRRAMLEPPLSLEDPGARDLLRWGRIALDLRRRGAQVRIETLRAAVLPVSQLLDERFVNPALKGLLALSAVRGLLLGPRSAGTAFQLLYRRLVPVAPPVRVRGGGGAVAEALARALRGHGGVVRTGKAVTRIRVREGRAIGVTLSDGEEIDAGVVLSSLDPRRTFFDLVGAPLLEPRFVRKVRSICFRAASARVLLGLSRLPAIAGIPPDDERMGGSLVVCPSIDYLERAYDAAKHGELSPLPALEVGVPSFLDRDLAPAGHHVMTVEFHYAPYQLARGGWEERGDELFERAMAVLGPLAPDLESAIVAKRIETPLDVEREIGATCGDIHHGQMALDQLFFLRPVPGFAHYATPIADLYLCGAGTHPGGGMAGLPGRNAAMAVLRGPGLR